MLNTYLAMTARLLQNPAAPSPLYSTADLTLYINSARGQLAGESKSVRAMGTLAASAGVNNYAFSSITVPGASSLGITGVLDIETLWYSVGQGQQWVRSRPWPWFARYELSNPVPDSGPPKTWAQFGQGAAAQASPNPIGGGSLYVSPLPDYAYTLLVDAVCYPIPLASDSDPEALPYLWTDAVPYFAAYLALMSAQSNARTEQALGMYKLYEEFAGRARQASTPMTLPGQYPQQPNLTRQNQLGVSAGGRG